MSRYVSRDRAAIAAALVAPLAAAAVLLPFRAHWPNTNVALLLVAVVVAVAAPGDRVAGGGGGGGRHGDPRRRRDRGGVGRRMVRLLLHPAVRAVHDRQASGCPDCCPAVRRGRGGVAIGRPRPAPAGDRRH